jgi:hypothetical protein
MTGSVIIIIAMVAAGLYQPAQPPEANPAQAPAPALVSEYNARREKISMTADAHWILGLWCEQKGLKDQAMIEFVTVTQLDPRREPAWKKLGYVRHEGRWTTAAELGAERAEAEAQRKADARWRPSLQTWKARLARKNTRAAAEAALAALTDPLAVPSIWKVFAMGAAPDQEQAIDILGHIEGGRSSRALAGLAVLGQSELVRHAAVETLIRRNPDDVLMSWIGLLRTPIKYEVRQVAGPGSAGVLLVEGERFNARRFYTPPSGADLQALFLDPRFSAPVLPLQTGSAPPGPPPGSRVVGSFGTTVLLIYDYTWALPPPPPKPTPDPTTAYQQYETSILQAQINRDFELVESAKMAAGAQAQLQHDVDMIEQANATIRERNARLAESLRRVAGKDLGEDRGAWLKWYMNRRGYSYTPANVRGKGTVDVQVPLPYVPQSEPPGLASVGGNVTPGWCMLWRHDKGQPPQTGVCFAATTAVLTPDGPRAIAVLRAGDLVVSGDAREAPSRTAAVLTVRQAPSPRTLRLVIRGEPIVTTDGHPFLKLGSGWTKAGDLAPGDDVLTRDGRARVEASEHQAGATVWNLKLAGSSSFLVGRHGIIVHDGSPIAAEGAHRQTSGR